MFKNMIKRFQDAQMRRVAYWQLQNLSDNDLKDIGIGLVPCKEPHGKSYIHPCRYSSSHRR